MEYVVNIYSTILHSSPHDPIDTLILSVVAVANVAHLNSDKELSRTYAGIEHPEPFEMKRPITRNAVAQSLNLPYETIRRRTQRLVDKGSLIEIDGGLVGGNEGVHPEMVRAMAEQNVRLLRRMVRNLRDQGVEI